MSDESFDFHNFQKIEYSSLIRVPMILSINFIVKDNFKTKKENNSDVSDTLWKYFFKFNVVTPLKM